MQCAGRYTTNALGYFGSTTIAGILPCDCTHTGMETSISCGGDGGPDAGESCSLLLPNVVFSPRCQDSAATCDGRMVRFVACSPAGGALPPPELDALA
ncbi:MAG: hypothetical protein U0269_11565 [Polyangiales bacterium]